MLHVCVSYSNGDLDIWNWEPCMLLPSIFLIGCAFAACLPAFACIPACSGCNNLYVCNPIFPVAVPSYNGGGMGFPVSLPQPPPCVSNPNSHTVCGMCMLFYWMGGGKKREGAGVVLPY